MNEGPPFISNGQRFLRNPGAESGGTGAEEVILVLLLCVLVSVFVICRCVRRAIVLLCFF